MSRVRVISVGNSLGIVLPEEVIARLDVVQGDTLFLTDALDGYRLSTHDPVFEAQTVAARKIAKKRRSALRALKK